MIRQQQNKQLAQIPASVRSAQRRIELADALMQQNMAAKPQSLAETLLRLGGGYLQNRARERAYEDMDQAVAAENERKMSLLAQVLAGVSPGAGVSVPQQPMPPVGADPLYQMRPPTSAPMTPSPVPDLGGGAAGASGLPALPSPQGPATTPPAGLSPSPAGGAFPQEFPANPSQPMTPQMALPGQQAPQVPDPMRQALALQMVAPEYAGIAAPFLAEQMRNQNAMQLEQMKLNQPDYAISGGYMFDQHRGNPVPLPQQAPADPWRATDGGMVNQATGEFRPFPGGQGGAPMFPGKTAQAAALNRMYERGTPIEQLDEYAAGKFAPGPNGEMSMITPGQAIAGGMGAGQPGAPVTVSQVRAGSTPSDVRTRLADLNSDLSQVMAAEKLIQDALSINDQARGGGWIDQGAQFVAKGLGVSDPATVATSRLDKMLSASGLDKLVNFKGATTDYEARLAMERLSASINEPADIRRAALLDAQEKMRRQRDSILREYRDAQSVAGIQNQTIPSLENSQQPQQPAAPQQPAQPTQRFRYDPATDQMVPQ